MEQKKSCCPYCRSANTFWKACGHLFCRDCSKSIHSIKEDEPRTWVVSETNEFSQPTIDTASTILDKIFGERYNTLKDSGARREFETGAVRDIPEGKGRCDLLPLDVVARIVDASDLVFIEQFKETKIVRYLICAIKEFGMGHDSIATLMLDVAKHFEAGAAKYGENNWKKGIPLHCYIDSAIRHRLKHLRGDTDEPHDRAYIWNLMCGAWTITHNPALDDIEKDICVPKCIVCGRPAVSLNKTFCIGCMPLSEQDEF